MYTASNRLSLGLLHMSTEWYLRIGLSRFKEVLSSVLANVACILSQRLVISTRAVGNAYSKTSSRAP